jgi:hypothetical protein
LPEKKTPEVQEEVVKESWDIDDELLTEGKDSNN